MSVTSRVPHLLPMLILAIESRSEIITDEPYAMTSFPELENFYEQIRSAPDPTMQSQLTPERKQMICEKIFMRNVPLNVSGAFEVVLNAAGIERTLERRYPRIHEDLFEIVPLTILTLAIPRTECNRLVNRSKVHPVWVGEREYAENVFSCLVQDVDIDASTRQVRVKQIKRYYVSERDYNVNEAPHGEHIVGRFVFRSDEQNRLVVHALAEESAPLSYREVKQRYTERRNKHDPTRYAKFDPVCKLDNGRRLRLCASVWLAQQRRIFGTVRAPNKCKLRHISSPQPAHFQRSSEWTIGCKFVGPKVRMKYYVSRSYRDNEIFVFKTCLNKTLRLFRYQTRVSVVRDTPVRFNFDDVED